MTYPRHAHLSLGDVEQVSHQHPNQVGSDTTPGRLVDDVKELCQLGYVDVGAARQTE